MREMIQALLTEHQQEYDAIEQKCDNLMRQKKPWEETAKKGAGLKMMIAEYQRQLDNLDNNSPAK